MVCKKCGKQFEGVFCPYCGERNATELPPECPVCSTPRKDQERFCSNCGYSYYGVNLARLKREEMAKNAKTNAQNAVTFVKKHRTPFIAAAVLLVLVLIVVIPTTVWATNIFRTGKVDQISIGMSQKEVIDKLGMPYDYSPNSSGFSYYSDNYLKLKEKLDSLDLEDIESFEELEDAIINEEKYREELENTVYDYIYIGFDGDGLVDSVFFDNEKCDKDTDVKKRVKNSELIPESVVRYQETPVYYRVEYTDGSLYKGLVENVTAMDNSSYSLEWTDRYGNDFQDRVEVTPNPEIAAMGECGEDAIYAVDMEGVMTISGTGIVIVPDDHNVREAEVLVIAEEITAIADEAFDDLTNISAVELPVSLTVIGNNAFRNCEKLVEVKYQGDLSGWLGIEFGGSWANPMNYAENLYINGELVQGDIIIPEGTEKIGDYAFCNCSGLTSVTIPDSVTDIGDYAFSGCSGLTSITIPDSVTSIGNGAFSGCSGLTDVYYQGDLSGWLGIEFADSSANPMVYTKNVYIDGELLQGDIVIPDGTEKIGDYAFYNCSGLTSIIIPGSVTDIGDYAFSGCSNLTSITIPFVGEKADGTGATYFGYIFGASVYWDNDEYVPETLKEVIIAGGTNIGEDAFSGCSGLTSVTIPDSVTSIGERAFSGCSGLTSIVIPDSVTSIGGYAFLECSGLTDVYYQGDLLGWLGIEFDGYDPNPMYYADNLYINGELLQGDVVIPDGVTSIGNYAFRGCSGLTSVTISDSVTSIGNYAFYGCSGLTSISIPFVGANTDGTGSTSFDYIFGYDVPESLQEVIITGGENIADGAFEGLASLTTVIIPGTVTELGDDVFAGCSSLEKIIFNGTIEQWEALESNSSGNDKLIVECTDGRYRFFVTYDLDGGVTNNPSSYTVLTLGGADGSIALSDPSKKGEILSYTYNGEGSFEVTQNVYTFLGWYKDASFEQKVTALTLDLGDVTLYAKWSEPASQTQTVQVYTREGDYIYFGEYPQTLKADAVTVGDVADEDGYYLGSDGERYAKVVADPYGSGYTFSDGSNVTSGNTYYFKVEPIRWRILSESDGSAFILADGIIANHYYHHRTSSTTIEGETVYANNYKHSDIRAWLNGEFLNTAFGEMAQGLIETAEVDNSVYSTGYSSNQYACENTFDKVFLLSCREVTNSDYGFSSDGEDYDTARRMTVSDYARSTGVNMDTRSSYFGCGSWWLRSPRSGGSNYACHVYSNGAANFVNYVDYDNYGVVPALNITL